MTKLKITILFSFLSFAFTTPRGEILCSIPKKYDHVSIYINSIWDDTKACSEKYNIPHGLIIAQCCLESKYGASRLAKFNNHLGIKFEGKYAHFETFKQCLDVYGRTLARDKYQCFECQSLGCWLFLLDVECYHYGGNFYTRKIKWIHKTFKLDLI